MWKHLAIYLNRVVLGLTVITSAGCATQSVVQFSEPYKPERHQRVSISHCIDRSGYVGDRHLAEEGTRSLTDKVRDLGVFQIAPESQSQLLLTCEIEQFVEGSALKRWVVGGWGRTQAQIAVMVFEKPGDKVLATLRSHAEVSSGGLYTIGADRYILGAAVDDVVDQLESWVRGKARLQ